MKKIFPCASSNLQKSPSLLGLDSYFVIMYFLYVDKSKPDLIITKKKALSIEPCDNGMQPIFFECPFQDRHSFIPTIHKKFNFLEYCGLNQ